MGLGSRRGLISCNGGLVGAQEDETSLIIEQALAIPKACFCDCRIRKPIGGEVPASANERVHNEKRHAE